MSGTTGITAEIIAALRSKLSAEDALTALYTMAGGTDDTDTPDGPDTEKARAAMDRAIRQIRDRHHGIVSPEMEADRAKRFPNYGRLRSR